MINVVGAKESAGLNIALAVVDFLTQVLLVIVGAVLVLGAEPGPAGRQRPPRRGADVEGLHPRDPDRHDRLHGHRDDLEHGRGGQGRDQDDPGGDQARARSPSSPSTSRCPRSRSSRCRSRRTPTASYTTLLGLPEEQGGYAGDPIAGVVANLNLGAFQRPAEIYVGILAATILFLATNAGLIGVSRLVYSMGIHRQMPDRLRQLHPNYRTPWIGILVFGVVAILITLPGQADVPRQPVRVRGDAVVHDRPLWRSSGCGSPSRTSRGPTARPATSRIRGHDLPVFAVLGGLRDGRGVRRHDRAAPGRRDRRRRLADARASSSTCSTGARRGWT